jgi:hypothetical protein
MGVGETGMMVYVAIFTAVAILLTAAYVFVKGVDSTLRLWQEIEFYEKADDQEPVPKNHHCQSV